MMTQSTCYKGTSELTTIKGVLWHSTGANNPNLKRYVQPDDNAANKDELLELIGTNPYKNDFNHINRDAGLNAWIGKLANGEVATIQTMPWNFKPWGCGRGSKGSCNDGWIQFEILEDNLTDKNYFNKVYQEACELTAYLCKMYNLNPKETVKHNGVNVPVILCHADSYNLKLGSNHGDVLHWFKKHNKTMDDVRNDVAKLMGSNTPAVSVPEVKKELYRVRKTWEDAKSQKGAYENLDSAKKLCDELGVEYFVFNEKGEKIYPIVSESNEPEEIITFKEGDLIKLIPGATYTTGKTIPAYIINASRLYIRKVYDNNKYAFSTLKSGAITGLVYGNMIVKAEENINFTDFKPYIIKVDTDVLNIRAGAGTKYKVVGEIKRNGLYTIVAEKDGWGKLKSGAGWISLDYVKKVGV